MLKCLLCEEGRYLEKCHIIPREFDWYLKTSGYYQDNLLLLCSTHHKLFDKGLLSEGEFNKIKDRIYITIKWAFRSIIDLNKKIDNNIKGMNIETKVNSEEFIKDKLMGQLNKKVNREWLINLIKEN